MSPESPAGAVVDDLTAVITSKNRWVTLRDTLTRMAPYGLPMHVIDDASDTDCPFVPEDVYPGIQVERRRESAGVVVRRNELARDAGTNWLLSLDDDSYIYSGDLGAALAYAQSVPQLLALSFPVFNPRLDRYQSLPLASGAGRVRSFIGCAHLMHRERFLSLGGYEPEIVHQGEEEDLAARALLAGFVIHQYPELLVHHSETLEYRNWNRMDYYGGRNALLWADWYVPDSGQLNRRLRRCAAAARHVMSTRRLGLVKGHWAARAERRRLSHKRNRFTAAQYATWLSLPHC